MTAKPRAAAPQALGDTIYLQLLRPVTGYGNAGDTIQLVESVQTEAMVTNGLAVVVGSPASLIPPSPTSIRWQPYTHYPAGWVVLNPTGQWVSANVDFVSAGAYSAGNWTALNFVNGVTVGNKSTAAATLYSGSGAPTLSATSGDFYLRTDTPGTANQRLYACTGTTNWTALL